MTSPTHRMVRVALAAGALTLMALFGTAGLAAADTAPSQSGAAANHPMRSMSDCPPACCANPLCCDPLCCAGMSDMTALPRLVMTSARHSGSCDCCNGERRVTTVPAAPVADNDTPSCAACCDTPHNAA